MNTPQQDISSHTQSQLSEHDEKQELAAQVSRGAAPITDDPSRAALHTGEDRSGSLETRIRPDGSPEGKPPGLALDSDHIDDMADTVLGEPAESDQLGAGAVATNEAPSAERQSQANLADNVTQARNPDIAQQARQDVQFEAGPTSGAVAAVDTGIPSGASFTSLVDESHAPEDIVLDNTEISENAPGAVVGTLSVVDPDQVGSHSFLVSDDRFEVVGGNLQLKPGVTLDHEASAQIEIEVTVTDSDGLILTEQFTVDILDANEAPDSIGLDGTEVSENAAGAVVGTLTITDPDSEGTFTVDVSDDRFEIVDGNLQLKPGASLNHEDAALVQVDVTATDAGGLSLTERFTIDVQDVNESPQEVRLDNLSVAENAPGGVIGNLSALDPDIGDSHSFHVSDDRFEIVDGQLRLKPDVAFNHEEIDQINLQITATDTGGLSTTKDFIIAIQDVNEGPTNLTLSPKTDNLVFNGSFEEFDVDQGRWRGFDSDQSGAWSDTHGIEIWDQLGGTQASDGDQLMELDHGHGVDSISQVIQTVDGQLYDLGLDIRERLTGGTDTVEVYWNGNLVAELDPQSSDWETFQLQVVGTGQDTLELREPEGQNDSYGALIDNITLTASTQTIAENVEGAIVGQLSFDDPDLGDAHRFEVSDDRFEVVDSQLRLKPGVALNFDDAALVQVDVTVIDTGGASQTVSFQIDVADMPDISVSSGFSVKHYNLDPGHGLESVDWDTTPIRHEVVSTTDAAQPPALHNGPADTVGVEISGNFVVEDAGRFSFHLDNQEGATLVIDGVPVIVGDHGQTGEVDLASGTHVLEVRYVGRPDAAGPTLEWEGPGVDGREAVTAPDLTDAQTVSGMPIAFEFGAGLAGLSEETRLEVRDLPEGTEIVSDIGSVIAGPEGSVELAGWQGQALSITPPVDFAGHVQATLHHSTPTDNGTSNDRVQSLEFDVNPAQITLPSGEVFGGFTARFFDVDHKIVNGGAILGHGSDGIVLSRAA